MLLAEYTPSSDVTQMIEPTIQPKIISNDNSHSEEECEESFTTIKIPLISTQPILAASNTHILVNEYTKRRKQFVLYDDEENRYNIYSSIKEDLIKAVWCEQGQCFLVLTSTKIYQIDLCTKQLNQVNDIIPTERKPLKTFTLLNGSTLLLAYDEWGTKHIEYWQLDDNNHWKFLEKKTLEFTLQEFIGDFNIFKENECIKLVLTIYNDYTEEWRAEIRDAETFEICDESIRMLSSNLVIDPKLLRIENSQQNIKWLYFTPGYKDVTAVDENNKQTIVKYRNPVQNMIVFDGNYLIIRIRERIDIQLFK